MSYLFKVFAISILVPTPSVQATIFGCFILFGISEIEPKPPILENFFLPFLFDEKEEIKLINLSAALMSTPLFLYLNYFLFINMFCVV